MNDTKQRILDAAAREFARRGYLETTIRAICARAKVNVAAVNYHFNGKDGLYRAVFDALMARNDHASLPDGAGISSQTELETVFREWITNLLRGIAGFAGKRAELLNAISVREFVDPSAVYPEIFEQYVAPTADSLLSILKKGTELRDAELHCKLFSILGSCLYYFGRSPLIRRVSGNEHFLHDHLDKVIEEIYNSQIGSLHYHEN